MKRVMTLLLCFTLLFSNVLITKAEDVSGEEGNYYYTVTDGKARIFFTNSAEEDEITLPTEIAGYPVDSVNMRKAYGISKLVIPDGIKEVTFIDSSHYNFPSTYALKSLEIGKDVSELFLNGCRELESIKLSEDNKSLILENGVLYTSDKDRLIKYLKTNENKDFKVPETVEIINTDAFYNSENLETIDLSKVKEIRSFAFMECKNLSEIVIPETVWEIGREAFAHSGLKTLRFNVKNIEYGDHGITDSEYFHGAFQDCKELKRVYFKNGLNFIPFQMFYGCESLEKVHIPKSVKEIVSAAFKDCTSLKKVKLRKGIRRIGSNVFENCTSLKNINLPNTLEKIDNATFKNCKSLRTITIPKGVKRIGNTKFYKLNMGTFIGCNKLKRITIKGKKTKLCKKCIGFKELREENSKKWEIRPMAMKKKIKIFAPKGSNAQKYAKRNKIKFRPIKKK